MTIDELVIKSIDVQESMDKAYAESIAMLKRSGGGIPSASEINSVIALLEYGRDTSEEMMITTNGKSDASSFMINASATIVANQASSLMKRLEKLKCQLH